MISIYNLKPRFQQLLKPLLASLHKSGVTPNQITIAALLLSACIGIAVWYNLLQEYSLLVVPLGLTLRMILNALDGMMASAYNLKSKMGEVLNELCDVLSDIFIYLPLIKITGSIYPIFLFVLLAMLNEFSGILAKAVTGIRRYEGPMGKSDRAFIAGMYCLLLFFGVPLTDYAPHIFISASALMIVSTLIRLTNSLK